MSNIGLELALQESGIGLVRTAVGDKYVMEEMLKRGITLGGEQSGHIIFSDHLFTGDGIATALNVLRVIADTGRELADLASELVAYPQVLVNVRVRERKDLSTVPSVADAMKRVEQRSRAPADSSSGYSGTEPLLRIMIEGPDQQQIDGLGGGDRRGGEAGAGLSRQSAVANRVCDLAVNIDHIATIRQARKAQEPDPLAAALIAERAARRASPSTCATDRRHIQDRDLEVLRLQSCHQAERRDGGHRRNGGHCADGFARTR